MSIASEIERIQRAKESIIETLKANDIEVQDGATMNDIDVTMKEVPILDTSDATATAGDVLKDKTFYAKGEKLVGTLLKSGGNALVGTTISAGALSSSGLNSIIKEIQDNLVVSGTSADYLFYKCSSLKTISQLDTSNVTTMRIMFSGCSSLEEVPQLDTSKVTDMSDMFKNCESLKTIPQLDTSNVTVMTSMFYGCSSLEEIPQLDTSKVTYMNEMFRDCSSLEEIPQLNTSNVTDITGMFRKCSNLKTIPQLDISNVTSGIRYLFTDCSSLTDESLNNILAMCINAVKITSTSYKRLSYIGLTSAQATRCQSLSNYQAFLDAGWTTGY